ncbi:hypothetical protein B0T11DRAFT_118208 [Plectosphaerella cucumerina]|uniref:Uncharacterized protein n=1 Tax=Plectosphaerella cucumerina TaxID=40658 RepID=A0A8K0X1D0_9PEZI|nr:hypothetical protein B0T11DRAFT_118208 [Plectosphaerella cucumerina]
MPQHDHVPGPSIATPHKVAAAHFNSPPSWISPCHLQSNPDQYPFIEGTVAEWLTRRPARKLLFWTFSGKPVPSGASVRIRSVSTHHQAPTMVHNILFCCSHFCRARQHPAGPVTPPVPLRTSSHVPTALHPREPAASTSPAAANETCSSPSPVAFCKPDPRSHIISCLFSMDVETKKTRRVRPFRMTCHPPGEDYDGQARAVGESDTERPGRSPQRRNLHRGRPRELSGSGFSGTSRR